MPDFEEQRRSWRQDRAYNWLVLTAKLDQSPEVVGRIALTNVVRGAFQNAYLGYWIAKDHTRGGYATEAVGLLMDFAFRRLELHRVQAAVRPDNRASRRVLEKAGFREEGLARSYLRVGGEWRDHVLYARTATEIEES